MTLASDVSRICVSVGIPKSGSIPSHVRVPERAILEDVEGGQRRARRLDSAPKGGVAGFPGWHRNYPGCGIEDLPHGDESIHRDMVYEKERVE